MNNTRILLILATIALIAAGTFFFFKTGGGTLPAMKSYSNYGISFQYPDSYALGEREVGNAERRHFAIVLIDKEMAANIPQNGEGPPSITIDIFQNNLDEQLVESWIQGSNDSNFKLSPDGLLGTTTVGGTPALQYGWDGLYRGESFVFAHGGNIVMMSVTYGASTDKIRQDFDRIKSSVALTQPR